MKRDELMDLARSIQGNAEIMQRFLYDDALGDLGPLSIADELAGRCNILDAKIAAIRELLPPEDGERRHDNLHVLGDRPTGDAA